MLGFRPGPRLATARDGHTATPLPGGGVLLAGGFEREGAPPLASAEAVRAGGSRPVAAMREGRGGHAAVPLRDQRVTRPPGSWSPVGWGRVGSCGRL